MIRVLLVDPERLLRQMLFDELGRERDLQVVGDTGDGEDAVRLARQSRPDVLLLRLLQRGLNGVQVVERVRQFVPEVGVVLYTSIEGTESLGERTGSLRCLNTNTCSLADLVTRVRRARNRETGLGAAPPEHRAAVLWAANLNSLTTRESEVLEHVVCTDLSVGQIGRALTQATSERVSDAAVRHALSRLMTKLDVTPRTRLALVKRVLEMGGRPA